MLMDEEGLLRRRGGGGLFLAGKMEVLGHNGCSLLYHIGFPKV
jgi:hypothetical protein